MNYQELSFTAKRIIKYVAVILLAMIFILVPSVCEARVSATKTDSAGETVYIAGNPDMYPIEYYDEKSETYKGVLPDLYAKISEKTGADFTYIMAGKSNRQGYLLRCKQAEIISAHSKGKFDKGIDEFSAVSYEYNGEKHNAYVCFSEAASDDVRMLVKDSFGELSGNDYTDAALATAVATKPSKGTNVWVSVSFVLLIVSIYLSVRLWLGRKNRSIRERQLLIDETTGIGNLKFFHKCYNEGINRDTFGLYYIAYIALDFGRVELIKGTDYADEMLRDAADVLYEFVSDGDFIGAAGKGAFAIGFQAPNEERVKHWLQDVLTELNGLSGGLQKECNTIFRAGFYKLETHLTTSDAALTNAKLGYNYAKQLLKSVEQCDKELLDKESRKLRIKARMSDAIDAGEFKMYLQLLYDTKSGRFIGGEALSRWINPEEGLLSPGYYVDSMISLGLISRLDFSIFEQACSLLEKWKDTDMAEYKVSCNFTRATASSESFAAKLRDITSRYDFDHRRLVVELTEDTLSANKDLSLKNIDTCRKLGFGIALDDFGSGYSAVNDICDYPADIVKIDAHIVRKASTERGRALLKGITDLMHNLGMKVVCEGVETESESKLVTEAGCDYIQGFYYSRALPCDEAEKFLRKSVD